MAEVTVVRTPTLDQVNALIVPGIINQYAGVSLPSGWLWCDGQELSISLYPDLYNAITNNGSVFPYGNNTDGSGGAGSTHFRVPNFKGKIPVGTDSTQVPFDSLGKSGGAINHTHNIDSTGSTGHNHTISGSSAATNTNNALGNHSHNVSTNGSNTGNSGNHGHGDTFGTAANGSNTNFGRTSGNVFLTVAGSSHSHGVNGSVSDGGDHSHSVNGQSGGTSDTDLTHSHSVTVNITGSTDTDGAHTHTVPTSQESSSLQPYITINYIIKY